MKINIVKIILNLKKFNASILLSVALILVFGLMLTRQPILEQFQNISVLAKQNEPSVMIQGFEVPSIFRDQESGISIAIQLDLNKSEAGEFEFYDPQTGYYFGTIPLKKSGKQIIHPQGTVSAMFSSLEGDTQTPVSIKMEGVINIFHNTAVINLWVNNTHYHLKANKGDLNSGKVAAQQAVDSMITKNWDLLYSFLSSQTQSTISLEQFIQIMTNSTLPEIISAELDGDGQIKDMAGYSYFSQQVNLIVRKADGSSASYEAFYYFVYETNAWRLLSTSTPRIK